MPTRAQFLEGYEFPVEVDKDFEKGGRKAKWAVDHPKRWGQEDDSISLPQLPVVEDAFSYGDHISSAVSDDGKLLAVTSRSKIYIYDIASKELRAELEGTGRPYFRPREHNVDAYEHVTENGDLDDSETSPSYTLLCGIPAADLGSYIGQKPKLILWDLDAIGRLLDFSEPIDASQLAKNAVESIIPTLLSQHEWTKDFIESTTLQSDIESALNKASAQHRRRHNVIFQDARTGGFGSTPFSIDGKLLLFHSHDETTQHGMRPKDQLPQVVVWDLETNTEKFRLTGHTDMITWSGISPSGTHIATVSWDGTMRVYSGHTGELLWVTENAGAQCWAGAFSPDSKSIVWTSKSGRVIKVHSVEDGKVIVTFGGKMDRWCRYVEWHPDGQRLVLCAGRHVFVWRPFEGVESFIELEPTFSIPSDTDWRGFLEVSAEWALGGKKLVLTVADRTILVWDTEANTKELFRRTGGREVEFADGGLHVVQRDGKDVYVSVDGDRVVRLWNIARPSEEDQEDEIAQAVNADKYDGPESQEQKKDFARDTWAELGAGIWT